MSKSSIIGVGMTAVGEMWDRSLREIAAEAVQYAMADAGLQRVDAIYVANAYGSTFNQQTNLGALIADFCGLNGVEAFCIEAGEASGGAAIRAAHLAVQSGEIGSVLVLGVEKPTDIVGSGRVRAKTISLDADYEAVHGATLTGMAALMMRRYMYEFGLDVSAFEGFSINAHANGKKNERAMYRNTIKPGVFANAPLVAEPVNLFDEAPDGDGAAAIIITREESAADLVPQPITIAGSAAVTDHFMIQDRPEMLRLSAAASSAERALAQAGLSMDDLHALEIHDQYTILAALSLEALGYAEAGKGWELAANGSILSSGKLPICTFGGLKSRGNPTGASGVYQAVEAVLQLRGQAGANQIAHVRNMLIQNLGGLGNSAYTHILRA
jgi:acetyl-CoA C-acetyltransferase